MVKHNRRTSDNEPVEVETFVSAFWRRYAAYWHVIVMSFTVTVLSVIWYDTVNAAVTQTARNTSDISILQNDFSSIKQAVDDLHSWYAADHGKRTE